ncbi:MAG: ribosome-associated translation inhibitor RaiA [Clostridia bacterium]|nr:ribosome-associated translation inhibitor RaiA [Clostridia bacterium]
MKIEIVERNYRAKDRLTNLITKKIEKFDKYLSENAAAKVVLSGVKDRYKMEVSVSDKGLFVRSEVETDNMYANLDMCLSKIERQIVKHSERLAERKRAIDPLDLMFFDELPEFHKPKITRRKHYDLVPMSEEEAMEQIELVGHDFYVFLNEATQKVNVIYARTDGDFGLIETDI